MRRKHLIGGNGQADIDKVIVLLAKGKVLCLLKFLQYEKIPAYVNIEYERVTPR